jgi:hypothetical protein
MEWRSALHRHRFFYLKVDNFLSKNLAKLSFGGFYYFLTDLFYPQIQCCTKTILQLIAFLLLVTRMDAYLQPSTVNALGSSLLLEWNSRMYRFTCALVRRPKLDVT